MSARYLLCPGWVTSRTDGQDHHIDAADLARLYGVSMADCVVLPAGYSTWTKHASGQLLARVDAGDLVALRPRYDGDYSLPSPAP